MRRQVVRLGIAFALALVLPLTALAGGWAVVTLDSTPASLRAGTPFDVGFMVLQHGQTPMAGLTPRLNFSRELAGRASGLAKPEVVSFYAKPEGEVGHYVATITLPTEGTWNWEVEAFGMPAQMSALSVAAAPAQAPAPEANAVAPAAQQRTASALPVAAWVLAGAIVLVLAAALLIVVRRPRRTAARV